MAFPSVKPYATVDPITSLTIPPIGAIFHTTRVNQGPSRGGWIYNFYLSGTNTPQDVYQAGGPAVPFSPTGQVTADAFGRFPAIYLDNPVAYKVTLSNSLGVVQQTQDPYNPALATTGFSSFISAIGLVINAQGEMTMSEAGAGGSGNELTVTAGLGGAIKIPGITPGVASLIMDGTVTTGTRTATFQASNRPGNELQYALALTAAPSGATYTGGTLTANFTGVTNSAYTIVLSTGQVILGCTLTNGSTSLVTPSTSITGSPTVNIVATFSTGVAGWLPVQCDGVLYYGPLFHGNSFTPFTAVNAVYQGQIVSAASVKFNGDGTVTLAGSGASVTPPTYYQPPQAGIGASTWINITKTSGLSGLTFSPPPGVWTNIGSGLVVNANGSAALAGTYQLSTSSGGTPVVASGTISLAGGNGVQTQNLSNGFLDFSTDGTIGAFGGGVTPGNWYLPTTPGIGSSYWLNVTQTSGGAFGGIANNTWTSLTSGINLYPINSAVSGTLQVSNTNSSSGLVASGTVTLGTQTNCPQPGVFTSQGGVANFESDGRVLGGNGSLQANWYAPTTTSIGSGFQLKIHVVSITSGSSLTGITADTFTSLGSTISVSLTGSPGSTLVAQYTIATTGGTICAVGQVSMSLPVR